MDALTTLLKFVHITAIAVWAAGLVCLPFLFAQRKDVGDEEALHRLHAMVRLLYVAILSPTAFVAIGSGTALIFLRATFEPWFMTKLALVGLMVVIHILSGVMILKLFDKSARYSRLRSVIVTGCSLTVVTAILTIVSAKPGIDLEALAPDWLAPGRLSDLASPVLGWVGL